MEIVLASTSARRRELLEGLGWRVLVRAPICAEERIAGEAPADMVLRLARAKCRSVPAAVGERLLGADTIVVLDGEVIGKPRDAADAARILRALAGRTHEVLTGYCVRRVVESGGGDRSGASPERARVVSSRVTMRAYSDAEIEAYVRTREPLDKAGAYGIQGDGAVLVESVAGSYTNVIGLPLTEVIADLELLASS